MKRELLLLSLAVCCGCSSAWVRLPHYPSHPQDLGEAEICRVVVSRTAGIESVRAEDVNTGVDSPSFSGSCRLILIAHRSGIARIKGYRPFLGITLFDAVVSPADVQVYVPRRGTLTTYRSLQRERQERWTFDEFVRVVLANVTEESDVLSLEGIQGNDWLTISVKRQGRTREELLVDRKCLLVRKRILYGEDGLPRCIVTFNRYSQVGNFWWPREWEVQVPGRNIHSHLKFDPSRLAFNKELPPALFSLKVPEDVERIDAAEQGGKGL